MDRRGHRRQVHAGKFPSNAAANETLVFGDVEKGFAEADLIIERDHNQQTTSHQPLETRTAMAYWQNGKLYLHGSTQSVARTVASVAGWVGIKPEELVLISEFTGGGFGSKIPGAHSMAIPALLSKKLNGRPVMMRISREEETYIGRTRPGYQGWIKMGFKKDGRMTACDVFVVEAAGPYRRQGDHATSANNASLMYQVPNMRFRGVSVATNTPPGTSQRAPGGLQASVMFEPMIDEAARKLGVDRIAIRKLNGPEGQAVFGLAAGERAAGTSPHQAHQLLRQGVPRQGRRDVQLGGAEEAERPAARQQGDRRGRGHRVLHRRFDRRRRALRHQAGRQALHPPGHRQSRHALGDRHRARDRRAGRHAVGEVRGRLRQHRQPRRRGARCRPAARRPTPTPAPTTRRGRRSSATCRNWRRQDLGGSPDDYDVANERVFRKGNPGRAITFAKAAERAIQLGGKFDGHEVPKELNGMTKASAAGLAGLGLMGVARDNLPRDGQTYSFQAAFIEIEVDVETGVYTIVDYLAVADVGTVMHPNSLGGQIHGGAVQGCGHVRSQKLVYDPHYGAALSNRLHNNKPPTILDIPVAAPMRWAAVELPDPTNPDRGEGDRRAGHWRRRRRPHLCACRCGRRRAHSSDAGAPRADHDVARRG